MFQTTDVIKIDRHNCYRQLSGLVFPHHATPSELLRNTIVDGELVIDLDPRTGQVREITFWHNKILSQNRIH